MKHFVVESNRYWRNLERPTLSCFRVPSLSGETSGSKRAHGSAHQNTHKNQKSAVVVI
jgi:hypothetical protein